jgi:hypothetical protein
MSDQEPDKQQWFPRIWRELRAWLVRPEGSYLNLSDRQMQLGRLEGANLPDRQRHLIRLEGSKWEEVKAELLELLLERGVRSELLELLERPEGLNLVELLNRSERLERRKWLELRELLVRLNQREGPGSVTEIQILSSTWNREAQREQPSELEWAAPISLYFDLASFSPTDIAEIISLLSELYTDIGGDGLVIDDITLLDFQPTIVPVEG